MRSGAHHAAGQFVRKLCRRDVEHARDVTICDQALHCLPTGAGRVKDHNLEAVFLENPSSLGHARGRDSEHRGGDQRSDFYGSNFLPFDHAGESRRRIPQYPPRQNVEPGNVHHGMNHRNVFGPDVGPGVSRGQGGNHDLRKSHGQRPHRRGTDCRACGPPKGYQAVDSSFVIKAPNYHRSPGCHGRHASAAILLGQEVAQLPPSSQGDFLAADVGWKCRLAQNAGVDH